MEKYRVTMSKITLYKVIQEWEERKDKGKEVCIVLFVWIALVFFVF